MKKELYKFIDFAGGKKKKRFNMGGHTKDESLKQLETSFLVL